MARYRLSGPAKADIAAILRRSEELYGKEGPHPLSRVPHRGDAARCSRSERTFNSRSCRSRSGVRSFHIRHSRNESREALVANPAHVLVYRVMGRGIVEIVRVLHDRMSRADISALRPNRLG
jgi:toxin ParE1/3/4